MSKAKISLDGKSRTCVLILGMHRSGTSALAGVLSKLGCELPAHQMEPSKSNAKGFFESTEVRDFNDELLASAGSSWDDFAEFHEDWMKSPTAREFLERAVSVLRGEFGKAQLFVLKDPRICRLVPFWTEALERFGCAVKPILTIRNPFDVGQSLATKRGFSEPLGEMLWLRHALDAEHATRGMARFHSSFEQLMLGWEEVASKAQDSLRLNWPKPIANVEFDVARFLSGDLRHHQDHPARALTSKLLPGWLRQAYEILNGWAENGEAAGDYPKLDRIKAEFDIASSAFARLVRAERENSAEPRQRLRELEEEDRVVRAEFQEQLAKIETMLVDERAAREAEKTALAQSLAERAALEIQLTDIATEAQQQRSALEQALAEQRSAFETELASLQSQSLQQIETLKQSLQDQRRRNTLLDAEVHQLKEERETLEAEFAASRDRRKEMARVIARRDAAIQARYQELAALERHILHSSWSWKAKDLWRRARRLARQPFRRMTIPKAA